MKHKHYDCIVAIAEGNPVEFSLDEKYWTLYEIEKHISPIDSEKHVHWRIKKEPEITVRYFKGQSDKNWNGMYVEINPDLEKWDLKITYQDGKEVKAEVTE